MSITVATGSDWSPHKKWTLSRAKRSRCMVVFFRREMRAWWFTKTTEVQPTTWRKTIYIFGLAQQWLYKDRPLKTLGISIMKLQNSARNWISWLVAYSSCYACGKPKIVHDCMFQNTPHPYSIYVLLWLYGSRDYNSTVKNYIINLISHPMHL